MKIGIFKGTALVLALLLCAFTTSAFPQQPITLEEAIRIALNKNATLKMNEQNIFSAQSNLKAAYGNLWPNVSANVGWNWTRSEDIGGTVSFNGIVFDRPASSSDTRNYFASVSAQTTIYDGLANYTNIDLSEKNIEKAEFDIKRLKQEVIFQTINHYIGLLNAAEIIKVREESLKWNQKQLELVTVRNTLGAVTIADVYSQQVQVGSSELELLRAKNDFETRKSQFLYYLGIDVLEQYVIEDPSIKIDDKEVLNYEFLADEDILGLVTTAFDRRYDYKSSLVSLGAALDNIKIAEAGHIPTLSNSLQFSLRSDEVSKLFDSRNYSVGLTLSVPIFSGWNITNRIQQAEIQKKVQEIQISDLEREIKRAVQKTHLDLQTASKTVEVAQRSVKAAEENRRIESEKYSLGATTLLTVLIANSNYFDAQMSYINARFEFFRLKREMEYYLGTLDFQKFE